MARLGFGPCTLALNLLRQANVALAKQASAQGLVLLQNPGSILPLHAGGSVAVIGPLAMAQGVLLGNCKWGVHYSRSHTCCHVTHDWPLSVVHDADLGQICPGNNTGDFSCVQTPLDAVTKANTGGQTIYSVVPMLPRPATLS